MSTATIIRWTRQADGGYVKEGNLPADIPTVRIFAIDEDYETNPHAVCPGLKLWPKEEAIALVERKIADGSYREWRYEIRPELSNAEATPAPIAVAPLQPANHRVCKNERCRKGPNGTSSVLEGRQRKYCSASCRVAVSRREGTPRPAPMEKPSRKPRSDRKYGSHAERQQAYQKRHSTADLPESIKDLLWMRARRARLTDKAAPEPA